MDDEVMIYIDSNENLDALLAKTSIVKNNKDHREAILKFLFELNHTSMSWELKAEDCKAVIYAQRSGFGLSRIDYDIVMKVIIKPDVVKICRDLDLDCYPCDDKHKHVARMSFLFGLLGRAVLSHEFRFRWLPKDEFLEVTLGDY